MKMLCIALLVLAGAVSTEAQVDVTTEKSADKTASSSQISVNTGDHTFVPLTVETKKTTVGNTATITESTTKALQGDGSYFDWRTTKSETKKLSDSATERTSDVVEKDRQGGVRVTQSTSERVTKSPDGSEQDTTAHYRRDSSGGLVLENQSNAVSKPNADGTISTTRVDSRADTNGSLIPVRRVEETMTKLSDNETKTDKTIQTYNHMDGGYSTSARESVLERKNGNTTTTETVVQQPSGVSWQTQARIVTTETRNPDGTIQRETVEQERPAYAQPNGDQDKVQPLEPKQKTIEREVKQPDGAIVTERQVLHRDINGDWKPETFSTKAADKGY